MGKSDVATLEDAPAHYMPGLQSWDTLANESVEILGYELARDDYQTGLIGVDLIITRVSFRAGVVESGTQRAYVSCESVISPVISLQRVNIAREASEMPPVNSLDDLPFEPGAHVVFNDGSTGIYRDVVKTLYLQHYIGLNEPITEGGARGASSFDAAPAEWASVATGNRHEDDDGFVTYESNVRIRCRRGLRYSKYDWNGQGAHTWYLG